MGRCGSVSQVRTGSQCRATREPFALTKRIEHEVLHESFKTRRMDSTQCYDTTDDPTTLREEDTAYTIPHLLPLKEHLPIEPSVDEQPVVDAEREE
eukprot:6201559-Pleurochrysis_carterae.AAC.2